MACLQRKVWCQHFPQQQAGHLPGTGGAGHPGRPSRSRTTQPRTCSSPVTSSKGPFRSFQVLAEPCLLFQEVTAVFRISKVVPNSAMPISAALMVLYSRSSAGPRRARTEGRPSSRDCSWSSGDGLPGGI